MRRKLTRWFPAVVKPVRPGIYQTIDSDLLGDTYYNLWDGARWYYGYADLDESPHWKCELWSDNASSLKCWRGLAEQPK